MTPKRLDEQGQREQGLDDSKPLEERGQRRKGTEGQSEKNSDARSRIDPRPLSLRHPVPSSLIQQIQHALKSVPRRFRADAWQEAFAAQISGTDPVQAVRAFAEQELDHEDHERTTQALTDDDLADALAFDPRMIHQLKEACERLLSEYPESAKDALLRKQDEQQAGEGLVHARDIASRLGTSQRWARKKMHKWAQLYGLTIIKMDPDHSRSPIALTPTDFEIVCRKEPHVRDRRRRKPPGQRKTRKIVRADDVQRVQCPRCRGRQLRNNGQYRNRRYVKCLSCSQRGARLGDFIVVLE